MDSSGKDTNASMETKLRHNLMPKNKLAIILHTEEGKQFGCVKCSAKYRDKEKLEVHLCSHFDEYRFICEICGTGLKRKEHLDRHTLGHQEVRPHVCPECGKGFKRKEHLNIHRSIHSGDKSQICPLCHRSFYRKDHLQKHLQTHTKMFMEQNIFLLNDEELIEVKQEPAEEEDVKHILGDCEVTMEVAEEDKKAQQCGYLQSSDPQRPFECIVCHKTYKRKDHLKLHSYTHLEKDKICSECGRGFHREEELLVHMNVHVKPYPPERADHAPDTEMHDIVDNCDIDILPLEPPELLVARSSGRPAREAREAREARPHECAVCRRKFKRKQHLKAHANVHRKNPQPTIWCSRCNQGFYHNSQFENHQCVFPAGGAGGAGGAGSEDEQLAAPIDAKKENDHPTGFVPIPIMNCLGGDGGSEGAEAHIPSPQRVYVCKYCQKPFKRKDHYKIHLHIHTGVRSFFCPDCGKGFYRKDHLQKHMQVHQKQKPKPKKAVPDLFPINMLKKEHSVKPEITITAPSNTKLRVPLQIKVPYQMVISTASGEQRALTVPPAPCPAPAPAPART